MPDISKITLPSGTTYDLKDAGARSLISQLQSYTDYLGVTTTALVDGSTTNPIVINQASITAKKGNIVNYNNKEFIFNGTAWQEFGDLSGLGDLAYQDTASTTYTPAGTVTQPTFTGSSSTFTGTFTPAGSVSFTNSNQTATVGTAQSGTATYTPEGSVTAPNISVKTAGSTTTIKDPTSETVTKTVIAAAPGATAPSNNLTYYAVSGETLSLYQLGYTTGASITTNNVTVKTGDAAYEATTPTFTGTGVRLVTGNISVPSSASFTGTEGNISTSGTPNGSVSQPSFSGTTATIEVS